MRKSLSAAAVGLLDSGRRDTAGNTEDGMQIVAFDFAAKRERILDEREKPAQPEPGWFYWIVAAPEVGFLFPAFDDRAANIYGALYYARDAAGPPKLLRGRRHKPFARGITGPRPGAAGRY